MKTKKFSSLKEILLKRSYLIELIILSVIIALGINFISDSLAFLTILSSISSLIIGICLCIFSILYLIFRILGKRSITKSYDSFFIYNMKKNEIIEIPRYNFSEGISEGLQDAFNEDEKIKSIWNNEPLKNFNFINNKKITFKKPQSVDLIKEIAEYYVLTRLDTHLADYFNNLELKKEHLEIYNRKDIHEILLNNRFMELFSKPMDERPLFLQNNKFDDKSNQENIIAAYDPMDKGGIRFEKFELILPKKTKIMRTDQNKIIIDMGKLTLEISVIFDGFNTIIPEGFDEYYLGLNFLDTKDFNVFEVNISIRVSFRFSSLLSPIGWEYYNWIDSFLEKLEENISKNRFFQSIGWEQTLTMLKCLENQKNKVIKKK